MNFVKCLQFIVGRMSTSRIIRLWICMAVFLPSCCRGKHPCKSENRQILDICEQCINNNFSFSFDIFKTIFCNN